MSDKRDFNTETPEERRQRRERARALTSGERGADGLTTAERRLLVDLRRQGLDVVRGGLVNTRSGETWQHARVVERG